MEIKWFAIMMVGLALAGSIGLGISALAESGSVSACAAAGMEWRDGDCLRASDGAE